MDHVIDWMRDFLAPIPWWVRLILCLYGTITIFKWIYRYIYRLRHSYVRNGCQGWKKKYWFGVDRDLTHLTSGEEHVCKYCGALTSEDDEYCYKNPNMKEYE